MHRTVIDEKLIIQCIRESRQSELEAKDEDNNNNSSYGKNVSVEDESNFLLNSGSKHSKSNKLDDDGEDIDFTKISELSLSFRDIYKIDHLRGFENLVKLRLDNNLIEHIENLGHLVQLQWLDLSFNNISKIEGLEELTELTDLCLVNNFIPTIEGLEHNKKLQVLSLGNNCIESIEDNILYLRQFEHLQALNLKGNPVYDLNDFKTSVFAYCEKLKFLDYERVKEADVIHSRNEKKAQLTEIHEKERVERKELEKERADEERSRLLERANIDGVDSCFDDMIRDDSEMIRLQNLPGFQDEIEAFKLKLGALTERYIESVVKVHHEKLKEDETLQTTLNKVSLQSETYSIGVIRKFESHELEALTAEVMGLTEQQRIEEAVRKQLKAISDTLMESEMQCVERINFIVNVYEDRITELMKKNLNCAESFFADTLSLENEYHQKLLDLIASILERIKLGGIDSVIPPLPEHESLRNMIMDKEAINNSIALSHDNHISHIGRLEDLVRDREEKEKKEKMKHQNDKQYKRNRQRISEIIIFVEKYAKQFNVKYDTM